MPMLKAQARARLAQAPNIWLATVRQNHTPHLVPIWFVWVDDKVYVCTGRQSVKARNIAANARVVFALEDGNDPVVVEADAKILETVPEPVAAQFETKYAWHIHDDSSYDAVIEITPRRVVL